MQTKQSICAVKVMVTYPQVQVIPQGFSQVLSPSKCPMRLRTITIMAHNNNYGGLALDWVYQVEDNGHHKTAINKRPAKGHESPPQNQKEVASCWTRAGT